MLLGMTVEQLEIVTECRSQPSSVECWQMAMRRWLEGQGARDYPTTWDGLYAILKDVGLAQLADDLKAAIDSFRKYNNNYYYRSLRKIDSSLGVYRGNVNCYSYELDVFK